MPEVRLSEDAAAQLEELPLPIHASMLNLIERLRKWPNVSGYKPLTGPLARSYRLRTGRYRLQFHLEDGEVIVDKMGHRDRFYE